MNSIPSLLALLFPLIAAAAVADPTTTTLATRNDPHSPCGVALYIGVASTRYTRNEICHVTGSTQPGGHGEVDLFTDKGCDRQHFFYNSTAPPPFGAKREYHNGDSIKEKNPVNDFTITQASGECQADGGNCYPVLSVNGQDFRMWDDPACTRGNREPWFGPDGYWWRCQIDCKA